MDIVNKPPKYLIVYHNEDNDGLFSYALLYQHLVNRLGVSEDNIEIFGANYEDMSQVNVNDWIKKYSNILMADISLPVAKMKKLFDALETNFVWCDHHAPIIEECNKNGLSVIPGSRELDRSGIMNVFDYLYNPFHFDYNDPKNDFRKPELLIVLSAFDSFQFERWGYTKEYATDVNEGVNIEFNRDPEKILDYVNLYMNAFSSETQFYEFNEQELVKFRQMGRAFIKVVDQNTARYLREYGDVFKVGTRTALAIFSCDMKGSDTFKSVKDIYENGIIFKRLKCGKWIISLYNNDYTDDSFHCGEYLKKKYGGGGHIGAAGCQVDEETFIKILKSKRI